MHIAESTHWYDRRGKPCYTVKAKAGHDRPTTLADARKLFLVPSVTTVIKCAAAPSLERWKAQQLMLSALTLPRNTGELEEEWLYRVEKDSQEQGRKAADRGTQIHAAIQGVYDGEQPTSGYEPYINGAMSAIDKWFGPAKWRAESSFAHDYGFGGKVDLAVGGGVVDFKTKEFDEKTDLKTWDEHAMQLSAYRKGLGLLNSRCAIVYVSTTQPGLAKLIEIPADELTRGWQMFQGLLGYWKAKAGFESGWLKVAA